VPAKAGKRVVLTLDVLTFGLTDLIMDSFTCDAATLFICRSTLVECRTVRVRIARAARRVVPMQGAERSYLASLDLARHQQAKSWELRTATSYRQLSIQLHGQTRCRAG
jgi:hypothetical protein